MTIQIKAPTFPESVADGTIANWLKKEGDIVKQDEIIAEIETDKVVLEVVAPNEGKLSKIIKAEGDIVLSAEIIGEFDNSSTESTQQDLKVNKTSEQKPIEENLLKKAGPAAKKLISENNLDKSEIKSSGKGNRVTKEDVIKHLEKSESPEKHQTKKSTSPISGRTEKRVPMSRLRATIADRLLTVKQNTAMLTTFNEVDMQPIKDLRAKYGEEFLKQHEVKLGFMGFFVIAAVQALKKYPLVNASIDGSDIVYHGFQDIGVAVSTERGLVVPVIKDADMQSLSEIEKSILNYSVKARDGKLSMDEMQGGTFTISNGGVFGSLLSTPILNAPQTAILGMHSIQDRPVAVDGNVKIRPMMYLAMSYDHRLLDGKEAVSFLVSIKEQLESPERLLLNL
ncbi:2-oxoglutarate dehydrogenase complex dihydrolipoyllysine-residue succinyltransferase [Gammaproteobacteria bacterium]|nr:2-oxoglutarate dehydrogenase complex dihydrolipoyllysine-residue succinyltransferase [Gammaproteobacteria bacterium]MDA7786938.1 2-oxoglutarate dehydrogenase complex dihydrolipoyllysine-residue succinyltransferase [Gammaproteobacteria bacterium]MDA7856720.1 2-oxoglutarate dehydrogenase complex dihydrolipoyllysine-residue succinyltransferase [Gammaproteobacteria bacterium]MDA9024666.1 2-oxoglutarate dehydrogenase complex dihydrolipoyllysine-residue succinyltransferase [Gammaproteobacteria bact|tara:strand:- start:6696 stop:7883 length:1188 start_codon:yes stop_codon:yes gene_type:complete